MRTIKEASEEIERDIICLSKQIQCITRKPCILIINKVNGIISDIKLETGKKVN